MHKYIIVSEFNVEAIRTALKAVGANTWLMRNSELRAEPPSGFFVLKITTRSASQMISAGAVIKSTGLAKGYWGQELPPDQPKMV